MKRESLCMPYKSASQPAENLTRNKYILEAYTLLVCRISNKLDINHNRAYKKFPRFTKTEITAPDIIEEFYTPICSVKLLIKGRNYVINLTVKDECLQPGHSTNSNAILRLAFEATQHDPGGFRIHDCLQISIDNNVNLIYKQKVEDQVNMSNEAYFKKKMKIEG